MIHHARESVPPSAGGEAGVFDKNRGWKLCAGFGMAQGPFEDEVKQQGIIVIDLIEGFAFFRGDMAGRHEGSCVNHDVDGGKGIIAPVNQSGMNGGFRQDSVEIVVSIILRQG